MAITRRQLLQSAPLLAAAPAAPVIDAHVHVWKIDPAYPFIKQKQPPPDRDATPEALLALMKANRVERAVLVQVSHHGWDHRFLADTLRRHPGRFVGVARVNPEDPAAPETLTRLVKQDGFRGLRLNVQPDAAFDWVKGPLMPPLWQACSTLSIPLCLQTKGARLPQLLPLCERFPELTIVIDHMADIAPDDTAAQQILLGLARRPRTYVKISHTWWVAKKPYPYPDALPFVQRLCEAYGARRLIFGSDWPGVEKYCTYAQTLGLVRREMKFLGAQDRAWVLGKTAATIWASSWPT